MNISVGRDPRTLELNGVPFYPPKMSMAAHPELLPKIPQISDDISLDQVKAHPELKSARNLHLSSWSLQAGPVHSSKGSGEEVIKLYLQVSALESHAVKIPEVVVTAIKSKNGDLLIVKTETAENTTDEQCKNWPMVCKLRQMLQDRLKTMREKVNKVGQGCSKGMGAIGFGKRPHRPHFRQGGHHGHQQHHGHHRNHAFVKKVAHFLLLVVIPILVGILAGMLTYLIGMLVGTGIALLWVRFRGRRQRYAAIALEDEDEEEGVIVLEKDDLAEEEFVEACM